MIYGYVRVSSDKQTTENQIFEIKNFAIKNNLIIDTWINETISGLCDVKSRKLGKLLKRMKKGDIMITSELSRLGRNLLQVMGVLSYCMEHNIEVWTIKDNYRLGTDIQSKVMAFAFGLSAEIERNLISQRTKEALARKKAEGIKLGRPSTAVIITKLEGHEDKIFNDIENNVQLIQIAEELNVSYKTIYRFLKNKKKNNCKC